MRTWLLGTLLACAHLPPAGFEPSQGVVWQFAIRARGHALAGLAVVDLNAEGARLQALSPLGVELFRVEVDASGSRVQAPDEAWAEVLGAMPFGRDLRLAGAWSCPEGRCAAGGGRVKIRAEQGATVLRYRGPGGPAEARREAGRVLLRDPVRGYELVMIAAAGQAGPGGS